MTARYHSTGQNNWQPKPKSGFTREQIFGPIQPMDRPGWLARLLGKG